MVVALEIVLAVAIVAVTAAFAGVLLRRPPERLLVALALLLLVLAAATAALVAVGAAIDRWELRELGAVAGGFLLGSLATIGAVALSRWLERLRSVEETSAALRARFDEELDRHADERLKEVGHLLAKERAESVHQLAQQELALRDERRSDLASQIDEAKTELTAAVTSAQERARQRLAGWGDDLERAQQQLKARLEDLIRRQADALKEHEARLGAHAMEVERLEEHQQQSIQRLRAELEQEANQLLETGKSEIETHAAERRRALHEVGERLRTRERAMRETIEREEAELRQQLQSALSDVERRHLEQLQRSVDRAVVRLTEEAERTFDRTLRESRERTADRLSRELELSLEHFMKSAEADVVKRISDATQSSAVRFQKQIDDLVRAAEVQTGVSNERIQELSARLDRSLAAAHDRLNEFEARVELELAAKAGDIERAVRGASQAAEQAQSRS